MELDHNQVEVAASASLPAPVNGLGVFLAHWPCSIDRSCHMPTRGISVLRAPESIHEWLIWAAIQTDETSTT